MDISKLKEFVRGILKGYSSLVIPVVIGLVGVLLFIPTKLMSGRLVEQMQKESVSTRGKQVNMFLQEVVVADQWKEEQKYQDLLVDDANQVEQLLERTTQRELLSDMMFPEPKDKSMLIFPQFGQRFRQAVDDLLERVNALDCPTEVELQRHVEQAASDSGRRLRYRRNDEVSATIREELCREKAESASVYANAGDCGGYKLWEEFQLATAESRAAVMKDCWYSQLGYWIIEDVIATIEALNSSSSSVFKSPVKRLLSVSFIVPNRPRTSRGSPGRREDVDLPIYVLAAEEGLSVPCTRRVCNDEIDVVHFNVGVIIGTKWILPFMKELCSAKEHRFAGWDGKGDEQVFRHNQITILEYKVSAINREESTHSLYRYGNDDVARVDLVCEYLFYKEAYAEVKPKEVKDSVEERKKKLDEERTKRLPRRVRPTRASEKPEAKGKRPGRRQLPDEWD